MLLSALSANLFSLNMEELKNLKDFLTLPEKPKFKSERAELVSQFVEALNKPRQSFKPENKESSVKGYKPLSAAFIASKMAMAGLKTTEDIRNFLSDCKKAKNFSAYWWWSMNPKNAKDY